MAIFNDLEPLLFWILAGLTAGSALMTLFSQNIVRSATWLLFTLGGTSGIFFLLGADFVGATQLLVYVGGTLILVIFGVMLTAQGPFITMKTSAAEWALSLTVGVALYAVLAISTFLSLYPRETQDEPERTGRPETVATGENTPQAKHIRKALPSTVAANAPREPLSDTVTRKAEQKGKAAGSNEFDLRSETTRAGAVSPYPDALGMAFLGQEMGPAHKENAGQKSERVVRTSYLLPFEIVSVHLLVVLIAAAYLARAKRRRGAAT